MDVVAETTPLALVERIALVMNGRLSDPSDAVCAKRLVDDAVVLKRLVVVALASVVLPVKLLVPEKVLLLARSVEEAAVIVMVVPGTKEVPLMRPSELEATTEPFALVERMPLVMLPIARAVVVALVRVTAPVKVLAPLQVLSVVVPKANESVSLVRTIGYVTARLVSAEMSTVAQVATPEPLSERTNWLVQDDPAYAEATPLALVMMRAD